MEPRGQFPEVLLEPGVALAVAAAATAQHQQAEGVSIAVAAESLPPRPNGLPGKLAGVGPAEQKGFVADRIEHATSRYWDVTKSWSCTRSRPSV
jgi:hypothetical protein